MRAYPLLIPLPEQRTTFEVRCRGHKLATCLHLSEAELYARDRIVERPKEERAAITIWMNVQ
jgi:hypothetical protein